MNSILEHIAKNSFLRFVDTTSHRIFTFQELIQRKTPVLSGVAFAYLNNSIDSVSWLFRLWSSPVVVALLPDSLAVDLKESLEKIYNPDCIVDFKRSGIQGFIEESNCFLKQEYSDKLRHESSNHLIHKSKIKLLLNTSGTTGSPKFVKLSEDNVLQNALSVCKYLPIQSDDVTPLNLPIYYSFGLSVLISNCIGGGTILCSNDEIVQRNFWENANRYQITSIAGVPTSYELLSKLKFFKNPTPSLRYLIQAGGRLNENLVEEVAKSSVQFSYFFYMMYGATEATARMSFLDPTKVIRKFNSIGQPISGGLFKIDEANNELLYKGPNVFGGYSKGRNDLQTFENIEWLRTGDLAIQDEEGDYVIIGRINRIVKIFGKRINLDELEQLINKKFETIVYIESYFDKIIGLFITFENDTDSILHEILDFLQKQLYLHKSVIKTVILQDVPLLPNGKINHQKLKELLNNAIG